MYRSNSLHRKNIRSYIDIYSTGVICFHTISKIKKIITIINQIESNAKATTNSFRSTHLQKHAIIVVNVAMPHLVRWISSYVVFSYRCPAMAEKYSNAAFIKQTFRKEEQSMLQKPRPKTPTGFQHYN